MKQEDKNEELVADKEVFDKLIDKAIGKDTDKEQEKKV